MISHTITFRGDDWDVEIDHDGGYEPDTNVHVIEWHFFGLTAEEHDALQLTDEEEQNICSQLVERRVSD